MSCEMKRCNTRTNGKVRREDSQEKGKDVRKKGRMSGKREGCQEKGKDVRENGILVR